MNIEYLNMSIITREANTNFRNSLRATENDQIKQIQSNGNPGLSGVKKAPIEIPTKFRVGINLNNPNYSKSNVTQHKIHNRKKPFACNNQERTYYKRTNSVNSISHIDHMVGVDCNTSKKPVIKLKSKIDEEINKENEGRIKVNRIRDYRTLFFYKENFVNTSLTKQSSLKDMYSNPFSEVKECTNYGVDIGKSQLVKRNNSSENIRVKSTRDYYYNSSQFQDSCLNIPYERKYKKEIDNKITNNKVKVSRSAIKSKIDECKIPSKESILSMKNKDDLSTTKKSLFNPECTFNRNNSSVSIYGIFNNTNTNTKSAFYLKESGRLNNDKIFNNQHILAHDAFPDKSHNRKAYKKLHDGIGVFY